VLALVLACIGLYGTISYGVGRRRSEIAVRMALGARYTQVLWMILRQALLLALTGVALGIPLSLWASSYVSTLLFGLTPRDPGTIVVTASILIAVASLAGYLPARRAAMVDPARALKQE
jgi:ABC-type antimicrobial peptide transport system permease subunit